MTEYDAALPTRLRESDLAVGAIYNAIFALKSHQNKAIRFKALLSELCTPNRVSIAMLNADFQPDWYRMKGDIEDGLIYFDRPNHVGVSFRYVANGEQDYAALEKGYLSSIEDNFDLQQFTERVTLTREMVGTV